MIALNWDKGYQGKVLFLFKVLVLVRVFQGNKTAGKLTSRKTPFYSEDGLPFVLCMISADRRGPRGWWGAIYSVCWMSLFISSKHTVSDAFRMRCDQIFGQPVAQPSGDLKFTILVLLGTYWECVLWSSFIFITWELEWKNLMPCLRLTEIETACWQNP